MDSGLHHDQRRSCVACKQRNEQRRVTLFLLANVHRLAIVTLRMVEVDQPVYTMMSDAASFPVIIFGNGP